jgi:hypothetical protein
MSRRPLDGAVFGVACNSGTAGYAALLPRQQQLGIVIFWCLVVRREDWSAESRSTNASFQEGR